METIWDYSDRAYTYDKRADYSDAALSQLIEKTIASRQFPIADIGAGTGKLTKVLLRTPLRVYAIEPNINMRSIGIKNTIGQNVIWKDGVGETTGLPENSFQAAFFGSSFNVVDQTKTLEEVKRILIPNGWFGCMWNHRDLNDKLQKRIEQIIHEFIPGFDYGNRRQDPTDTIIKSGYFKRVEKIEERFIVPMQATDIIDAWKSHDTLFRQSGKSFNKIIDAISNELILDTYEVPYFTRIWFSQILCGAK